MLSLLDEAPEFDVTRAVPASPPLLVPANEAIGEVRGGRAITLRHRQGYALIAPAGLPTDPALAALVEYGCPVVD